MRKLNKLFLLGFISFSVLVSSCKKDEEPTPTAPKGKYENGVIISNEGVFGSGNGSISFYSNEKDTVFNDVYKTENKIPLGDVVQSTFRAKDKTLIVVNASNKVVVVNTKDFKHLAEINIKQPRYVAVKDNKAYVSSWANNGYVYIVNLDTYLVVDSVKTGVGPEGVLINNNTLYVANSGGWGKDSTITVVNLSNNSTKSINIHADCPSSIKIDKNNKIWVLAKGSIMYDANWTVIGHAPSKLIQIDIDDNSITKTIKLFDNAHPSKLGINKNKDKLYYGGSFGFYGLYEIGIDEILAPTEPLIKEQNYGFIIDDVNNKIFLLQEAYTSNGKLIRYKADGTRIKEYSVGIYPSSGNVSKKK